MAEQNKYTPHDIAVGSMTFNIPLYQRLFAWKTKQVSILLEDLRDHFEKTSEDPTNPPYYLGMLTCVKDGSSYDLIDGQQRFTVMMLLAICLKAVEPDNKRWDGFLLNEDKPRLSFFAREEDQSYLSDKIYSSDQYKYKNSDMEAAITCIKAFLEKLGQGEKQREFSDNVFKRLTFFISLLPESYKKQPSSLNKYFEAMNAQGKSLEQHEILKVELMRHSPHQEDMTRIWNLVCQTNKTILSKEEKQSEEDYRNKYLESIQNCRLGNYKYLIENTKTDATEKCTIDTIKAQRHNFEARFSGDGDNSIISFSELLLIALDIERGVDSEGYDVNKLLTKFHSFSGTFDVWHFYQTLLLTRLILDYYVVRREVINGQGDFTLIVHDDEKNPEQLRQYQAMLAVSTDSLSWLRCYIKLLTKRDYKTHELLLKLKLIDNKKHPKVPSINELKYGAVDRYWFWRLDYYLWLKKDDYFDEKCLDAVRCYIFRKNRSIEHLHPQNEDNNTGDLWPEECIHAFGNLAMISQGFNSEQSNDNLELKFARIREQLKNKSLQSLKLLKMYCDANGSGEQWTQELVAAHQDEMIKILEDSYSE